MNTVESVLGINARIMDDGVLEERFVQAVTAYCIMMLPRNKFAEGDDLLDDPFEGEEELPEAFTDEEVVEKEES